MTLEVRTGSVVAVLGAMGADKSTLARAIVGLVRPNAGRVTFDGHDITRWSTHRIARAGVAHLPEGRGIFPTLSVLDNLRMGLRHAVPRAERAAAFERAFEHFPILAERRRQQAATLSEGEQQMLALARILAAPPRLLVADELTLGLASLLVDTIFGSLSRTRAAGVTIVVIEQYVERALALAHEAVILRRGHLAWRGPADTAAAEATAQYLGETVGGA